MHNIYERFLHAILGLCIRISGSGIVSFNCSVYVCVRANVRVCVRARARLCVCVCMYMNGVGA